MNTNEIFENRRAVAIKICQSIRKNGGQLLNAEFFLERPYCADSHSYKFSSANFLRLLAADNDAICKFNPRWFSADEIKNKDKDSFKPKNQKLETIIENLQARGLIENGTDLRGAFFISP